jgi:hypothetical protein
MLMRTVKASVEFITAKMKNVLIHQLRDYNICLLGRRAIASALRFLCTKPLQTTISPGAYAVVSPNTET